MVKINPFDELKTKLNKYFAKNISFLDDFIMLAPNNSGMPHFLSVSSNLPKYSRVFFNDEREIPYHLGGYSQTFEDAVRRMLGEAIERYSSIMTTKLFSENFVQESYDNLIKKNTSAAVLPIEYLRVYTNEQCAKMHKILTNFSETKYESNEQISWIKIINLVNDRQTYVPVQALFMSGHFYDQKQYTSSFSTGTAAHVSVLKAAINAISESLQINNFMLAWIGILPFLKIEIDDYQIAKLIKNLLPNNENINVSFYYIDDKNSKLPTIVSCVYNKNKSFPAYSYGVQSGFELKECLLRSFMEALAVFDFNFYRKLYRNKPLIHFELDKIMDLDTNVDVYATNYQNVPSHVFERLETSVEIKYSKLPVKNSFNSDPEKFKYLVDFCKRKYDFVFLVDITSPEFLPDFRVVRCYIPQNIAISFPSFLPIDHPVLKNKGVKFADVYIHPLP